MNDNVRFLNERSDEMVKLAHIAESVLQARYDSRFHVGEAELIRWIEGRSLVARLHFDARPVGKPATLILKQRQDGVERPKRYDRELASHQFFDALNSDHVPHFFGADQASRTLLLEDLGPGRQDLTGPLLGDDSDAATSGLLQVARRLGRLHADTHGRAKLWRKTCEAISPPIADGAGDARAPADEVAVARAIERLGLILSDAAAGELDQVAKECFELPEFQGLIHCDICPDNCLRVDTSYRLVDLEYAKIGSPLLDVAAWRMAFPTCWCPGTIPDDLLGLMDDIYRGELASHCRAARDDQAYERASALAAGHWMAQMLRWHLEDALNGTGPWSEDNLPARLFTVLGVFLRDLAVRRYLPALTRLAEQVLTRLESRWPDNRGIEPFPCFQ